MSKKQLELEYWVTEVKLKSAWNPLERARLKDKLDDLDVKITCYERGLDSDLYNSSR